MTANPRDVIPGGYVYDARRGREVLLQLDRPTHASGIGKSRRGKTTWVEGPWLHQALVRREGGAFFDPTAQAIDDVMAFLSPPHIAERVDLISREKGWPMPSYNLFDMYGEPEETVEDRLSAFANSFTAIQGWNSKENTRAINLSRQAAWVLLELGRKLPHHLQPTIFQLPTLLTNDKWRDAVLNCLKRPSLTNFWRYEYPKPNMRDASSPVTHMIYLCSSSSQLRALLGTSRSSFDWRRAMDEGRIVLICLGDEGDEQRILANLLLYDLVRALRSRGKQRDLPSFATVLDEVHTYDGAAGGSVADALEQTAKYGGLFYLLTQSFLTLKQRTQIALVTNTDLIVAGNLEPKAASIVAQGWIRGPDASVLPDLPKYHFVVDAEVQSVRYQFKVRAAEPKHLFPAYYKPELVEPLRTRLASHGRTAASVTPELERLDQSILDYIQGKGQHRPEVKSGGGHRQEAAGGSVPLRVVGHDANPA